MMPWRLHSSRLSVLEPNAGFTSLRADIKSAMVTFWGEGRRGGGEGGSQGGGEGEQGWSSLVGARARLAWLCGFALPWLLPMAPCEPRG